MSLFKRGELDAGAVEFVQQIGRSWTEDGEKPIPSWTAHGAKPIPWAACIAHVPIPGMHLVMVNIQWGGDDGPAFTVQGTDVNDAARRGARLAVDLLSAYALKMVVPEKCVVLHINQPFTSEGATVSVQLATDAEKVEA